uniref:Odorant receptor n=1 Tax=Lutzomyia longipalpis TaxID=7200 RepID=A0A7G3AK99_LUTLO
MLEEYHSGLKRILLFFFRAWGLDFLPKPKRKVLIFLKHSLYPIYAMYGVFCELWHLIYQMEDFSDLIDVAFSITLAIGMFQGVLIYLVIIVGNRGKIMEIFEFFEQLIKTHDPTMREIRRRNFEVSMRTSFICAKYFLSANLLSWTTITIFNTIRTNFTGPMMYHIPGLPTGSVFFYPINLIHQTIMFFQGYAIIMFSDVTIMITIMCCQAELEAIAEFISHLNDSDHPKEDATEVLRKIYSIHMILSVYTKKIAGAFWHIYLYKLLTIMMYLCSMFIVFQTEEEIPFVAVISVLVMASEVFILCFFGQILSNSSEKMQNALYMTKWYKMSNKNQKTLLMLMLRFQDPVKIETFAVGTITIYTFVQVRLN